MPPRPRPKEAPTAPGPAYFLSLTLENIRCFGPAQTLDLSDGHGRPAQWTVILGDNGTGKTTLLQALVAMQPYPSSHVSTAGLWQLYWPWEQDDPRHSHEGVLQLKATYATGARLSQLEAKFTSRESTLDPIQEPDWRLAVHGYGAARRLGSSPLAKTPLAPDPTFDRGSDAAVLSLFSPEAALINAEAWLAEKDHLASKEGPLKAAAQAQFDLAVRALIDLFPDDDIKDIRCVPVGQGTRTGHVEVQVTTPYGKVPLGELSFGYQTLTAWIVDLVARMFVRYPESKNPLHENAVVLVDEIDLHLHPKWQRRLFERLSQIFPNVQFIVTAHSPLVVQAAKGANLYVLHRPEGADHVVLSRQPEAIRFWRLDQILTSDLFELPSARAPEFDEKYERREALLAKARLRPTEKNELAEIDAWLAERDVGDGPAEARYLDLLRQAAAATKRRPRKRS